MQMRARDYCDGDTEEQVLFHGELVDAIAAARALPLAERRDVTLETDENFYGPADFDHLTVQGLPLRTLEMAHGSMWIRVTVAALEQLRGDLSRMAPPMSIITERLDEVQAIVRRKQTAGEIADESDGRRVMTIDVADLAPST
ncbi:hypothetical protein WP12_19290 [Sphingomonas sp. SRS2]|nr:hypothetical protein WP12_19290 [Sphingomonas sp. SRS2]